MTTAIAYGVDGKVYMAADSMTNVYSRPVASAKKIAKLPVNGTDSRALLSVAGAGALAQWISYDLELPDYLGDDVLDVWAKEVAEIITRESIDRNLTDDGKMESSVLLAFRGRVWTIDHFYAIAHPDNIGAIGSGEGPAIGALDALLVAVDQWIIPAGGRKPGEEDLLALMESCVSVAIKRDKHTGGEIQVEAA
jgi:ATP-dependent protease HslVU (ClpYQ) peptidase subunit